ncbi:MAG: hypothetical protein ACLPJH_15740 [Myxococcaceae bacterium]
MIEHFNIRSLLKRAPYQKSFHMAAEKHVRIEFWNMLGGAMTSLTYQGDIVLTCYAGAFRLESSAETVKLGELDQAVVPIGTPVNIVCEVTGTVQLIWTPPYAAAT